MGADSKIEWTHHTFNPWWGCEKIDPECKHCYAASFAKRTGHDVWGVDSPRRFFGPKHWLEPVKWNREAERAVERRRVFCASMADVFEDRRDLDVWRSYLWALIAETPHLDWLLLSKRPEHMRKLTPRAWRLHWPDNVWAGTSGGCQETADDNVPALLDVPARVHFLSAEPLLGPVDARPWMPCPRCSGEGSVSFLGGGIPCPRCFDWAQGNPTCGPFLDIVIVGAESGARARPMDEAWVRSLRDQCAESRTAFFYKQRVEGRTKVSLPLLDGRRHADMPEVRP